MKSRRVDTSPLISDPWASKEEAPQLENKRFPFGALHMRFRVRKSIDPSTAVQTKNFDLDIPWISSFPSIRSPVEGEWDHIKLKHPNVDISDLQKAIKNPLDPSIIHSHYVLNNLMEKYSSEGVGLKEIEAVAMYKKRREQLEAQVENGELSPEQYIENLKSSLEFDRALEETVPEKYKKEIQERIAWLEEEISHYNAELENDEDEST
jgi:hypothetical protein